MLIHKGAVYRQAITWPTWEEVWEVAFGGSAAFEDFSLYMLVSRLGNEEDAKKELQRQYEELRRSLPSELASSPNCFRARDLDPDNCTEEVVRNLDPLGIYWSLYEDKAIPYWGGQWDSDEECVVTYRAEVDLRAVDLLSTMAIRLVNPSEGEVRFKKNARIYVFDADVLDGPLVPIDDWRTL